MATIGKKIDDEELLSYTLTSLDYEYNSVVSTLVARPDTISIGEAYAQLVSYEQVERQTGKNHQASMNSTSRGRGSVSDRMGSRGGRNPNRGRGAQEGAHRATEEDPTPHPT
jgi:hypothetical protein